MITIFGCIIIGAIVGYRIREDSNFFAGILALLGLVVGTALSSTVNFLTPMIKAKTLPTPIVAMRTKDGLSGSFVYGCGSLQGKSRYSFLVKDGDGVHPESVLVSRNVTIIEDPKLKDRGEFITLFQYPDKTHPLFYFSLHSTETLEERLETAGYIFRVPVGSVVHQFSVE